MSFYLQNLSIRDSHGYRTYSGWYRPVGDIGPAVAMVLISFDERYQRYFGEVIARAPGVAYRTLGAHTSPYRLLTLATLWVAKFCARPVLK